VILRDGEIDEEDNAMTTPDSIDPTGRLDNQLATPSPDLFRSMVKTFADAVMPRPTNAAAPTTARATPVGELPQRNCGDRRFPGTWLL
jgi:hypothetical protein